MKRTVEEDMCPVFIVGCYRSGTTLMRMMLSAHSCIHISQETNYIDKVCLGFDGNSLDIKDELHDVYSLIERYLKQEGWEEWPSIENIVSLGSKEVVQYQNIIQSIALYGLDSKKRFKLRYWGDNTPQYIRNIYILNSLFPNAKFIVMLRDPRDVASSAVNLHFGGKTILGVGQDWLEALTSALLAQSSFGRERVKLIKYEDLVLNSQDTLQEVCDFLDLNFEENMMNYYDSNDALTMLKHEHHQSIAKPISSSSIGRYKTDIKMKDLHSLETYLANHLLALGYIDVDNYRELIKDEAVSKSGIYWRMSVEWAWRYLGHLKVKMLRMFSKRDI